MHNKIVLHSLTIDQCKDTEEKLRVARQAGYEGIDLMYSDVVQYIDSGHKAKELKNLLRKYHLEVSHLGALWHWQFKGGIPFVLPAAPEETKEVRKDELLEATKKFFDYCVTIGCPYALIVGDLEKTGSLKQSAEDLATLNEVAQPYGIKLALEFVGWAKGTNTLAEARDIVNLVNNPNVGILLDTFHFYRGQSKMEDLVNIPVEQVFIVHVNDVTKDKPLQELTDEDRVIPGKGVIPLEKILGTLEKKAYAGPFSIELLNPSYWKADPMKIAVEAKTSLEKILKTIAANKSYNL